MVMDFGRFGYKRDCRFFRDDDRLIPIQWYVAPEGAEIFPDVHKFSQLGWYSAPWEATGIGESYDASVIRNRPVTPPTSQGKGYFGELADFQFGAAFNPDTEIERDVWGLAKACCEDCQPVLLMEGENKPPLLQEDGGTILLEG